MLLHQPNCIPQIPGFIIIPFNLQEYGFYKQVRLDMDELPLIGIYQVFQDTFYYAPSIPEHHKLRLTPYDIHLISLHFQDKPSVMRFDTLKYLPHFKGRYIVQDNEKPEGTFIH